MASVIGKVNDCIAQLCFLELALAPNERSGVWTRSGLKATMPLLLATSKRIRSYFATSIRLAEHADSPFLNGAGCRLRYVLQIIRYFFFDSEHAGAPRSKNQAAGQHDPAAAQDLRAPVDSDSGE
jgi:hypothetical protein